MAKTHRGGRPPTLTPEVHRQIVSAVRGGNHITTSIALAGVPKSTFYLWRSRGDPAGTAPVNVRYRNLRQSVEQARGEAEVAFVAALVDEARQRDWRAAAKFLETAFPEHWGPPR